MSSAHKRIATRICIVGGGPAGIAVAAAAAKTGKSILLAESGSQQHRPEDLNEGAIQHAVRAPDRKDEKLIDGPSLYKRDYLVSGRTRVPGGSSRKWGVRARVHGPFCVRLAWPEAYDFQQIDDYNTPAWPVPFEEIERYLQKSTSFFGLNQADVASDTAFSYPFNENVFEPRFFFFAPGSVVYDQRFRELSGAENVEIQTGWTLKEIVSNSTREKISHLVFVDREGSTHKVSAEHYVIAAGGIENSRILLNAVDQGQLQDPHDVLGRWFMDHPHVSLGILKPNEPIETLGKFHDFQERNSKITLGHYSLSEHAAKQEHLLRFSITLVGGPEMLASPTAAAGAGLLNLKYQKYSFQETFQMASTVMSHPFEALRHARHVRGRGTRHHTALGGWSSEKDRVTDVGVLKLEAMMAQRPSPDNRVRLLSERDRLGHKKACLQWSWSRPEVDSYWRSVELTKDNLNAVRAGQYVSPTELGCGQIPRGGTGWHQMGGTRMSSSPMQGVVDASCRVHGVENLYVAGSSIFPSSIGYSNPTLTLVAFSLRLGDHLASL